MRYVILFIAFSSFTITACDCRQEARGIILDRNTKRPLDSVNIRLKEITDTAKLYSQSHFHSDKNGQFDYQSLGGGLIKCDDLILYFGKKGYKTFRIRYSSYTINDTVYLEQIVQ